MKFGQEKMTHRLTYSFGLVVNVHRLMRVETAHIQRVLGQKGIILTNELTSDVRS